jgi:hypothetical protein
MDMSKKERPGANQVKQYDKIFKENMEAALPGIMKHLLGIYPFQTEELPDSIQHTKEREPDVLKKVIDQKGNAFVLQAEFQLNNDPEMAFRMADYYIMLTRKYKLPVRQHVVYIGKNRLRMPDRLKLECMQFHYSIVSLSTIDYHLFLASDKPEEKILALLADFGKEDPEQVIEDIVHQISAVSSGSLEVERYKSQLQILSRLRNFTGPIKQKIMDSITKYLLEMEDKEEDILYQQGEAKGKAIGKAIGMAEGKAEANAESVKNLLAENRFTLDEISRFAGVTKAFVENIKKNLK